MSGFSHPEQGPHLPHASAPARAPHFSIQVGGTYALPHAGLWTPAGQGCCPRGLNHSCFQSVQRPPPVPPDQAPPGRLAPHGAVRKGWLPSCLSQNPLLLPTQEQQDQRVLDRSPFRGRSTSRKRRGLVQGYTAGHAFQGIFLKLPQRKGRRNQGWALPSRLSPTSVCPQGSHPSPGPTLPFLSGLMSSWVEDSPDG